MALKNIISASRRTDIPACYLDRLREWVRTGCATVTNPYSGITVSVSLDPAVVHTLVLWSKNFSPFLTDGSFLDQYRLYFLFTLNDMPALEPGLPDINKRLRQIHELSRRYGPKRIAWRFDPIVFGHNGPVTSYETFTRLAEAVTDAGVTRLIVSYLDFYGKVQKRNIDLGLGLIDPSVAVKRDHLACLAEIAAGYGFKIETCCENLTNIKGVSSSACIDGSLLANLAGEPARTAKDPGQRAECRCTVSRDIGSYHDMPCPAGCLYCYANPLIPQTAGGVR